MKGHKDADLMMAMAVEAQTSETPWDIIEYSTDSRDIWYLCSELPDLDGPLTHRLKPKTQVIDYSKVNYDIVPVKDSSTHVTYYSEGKADVMLYTGATLVTGKKIAWTGGECPLPEGVMVEYGVDNGLVPPPHRATSLVWKNDARYARIIWFEVTGLAEGYEWGVV